MTRFTQGMLSASQAMALNDMAEKLRKFRQMRGESPITVNWQAGDCPSIRFTPDGSFPVEVYAFDIVGSGYLSGQSPASGQLQYLSGSVVYYWNRMDYDTAGNRTAYEPGQSGGLDSNPLFEVNNLVVDLLSGSVQAYAKRRGAAGYLGQAFEFVAPKVSGDAPPASRLNTVNIQNYSRSGPWAMPTSGHPLLIEARYPLLTNQSGFSSVTSGVVIQSWAAGAYNAGYVDNPLYPYQSGNYNNLSGIYFSGQAGGYNYSGNETWGVAGVQEIEGTKVFLRGTVYTPYQYRAYASGADPYISLPRYYLRGAGLLQSGIGVTLGFEEVCQSLPVRRTFASGMVIPGDVSELQTFWNGRSVFGVYPPDWVMGTDSGYSANSYRGGVSIGRVDVRGPDGSEVTDASGNVLLQSGWFWDIRAGTAGGFVEPADQGLKLRITDITNNEASIHLGIRFFTIGDNYTNTKNPKIVRIAGEDGSMKVGVTGDYIISRTAGGIVVSGSAAAPVLVEGDMLVYHSGNFVSLNSSGLPEGSVIAANNSGYPTYRDLGLAGIGSGALVQWDGSNKFVPVIRPPGDNEPYFLRGVNDGAGGVTYDWVISGG